MDSDDDEKDADKLDRNCTPAPGTNAPNIRKKKDEDAEVLDSGAGVELVSGDLVFKKLYLLSSWKEPVKWTKKVSAAILLPSSVGPGDFSIRVGDGNEVLELTVTWPAPLVDLRLLH